MFFQSVDDKGFVAVVVGDPDLTQGAVWIVPFRLYKAVTFVIVERTEIKAHFTEKLKGAAVFFMKIVCRRGKGAFCVTGPDGIKLAFNSAPGRVVSLYGNFSYGGVWRALFSLGGLRALPRYRHNPTQKGECKNGKKPCIKKILGDFHFAVHILLYKYGRYVVSAVPSHSGTVHYMTRSLNVRLIALSLFLVFLAVSPPVKAQEQKSEEPETVSLPPLFVELYTSQACVFCPEADRLFADLIKQPEIIGVSCHVDYFDVKTNSLARPFCTERQSWYMDALKLGPNYTPQLIINGRRDVVGYKTEDIAKALKAARTESVKQIQIVSYDNLGRYKLSWPAGTFDEKTVKDMGLWLGVYNKPKALTIAEGKNRGDNMIYYHVLSRLTELALPLPGKNESDITVNLTDEENGFVVFLQDKTSGHILAAGELTLDSSL